jgi:hypothetical protein
MELKWVFTKVPFPIFGCYFIRFWKQVWNYVLSMRSTRILFLHSDALSFAPATILL